MRDDSDIPQLPSELIPVLSMLAYVPADKSPTPASQMKRMLTAYAMLDVCKAVIERDIALTADLDGAVPDDVQDAAILLAVEEGFVSETEYEGYPSWEAGGGIGFVRNLLGLAHRGAARRRAVRH